MATARSGSWIGPARSPTNSWIGRWLRLSAGSKFLTGSQSMRSRMLQLGIYRWPNLSRPLRTGDLRNELLHVCLDQCLAADAAYVVIAAAPWRLLTTAAIATCSLQVASSRGGSIWRHTPWVRARRA